jgi:fibronectin type 3 domain-containing protein
MGANREMKGKSRLVIIALVIACTVACSSAKGKHSVTLTWQAPRLDKGVSLAGYNVYRRTSKEHEYKKIATRIPNPSYEDTDVKSGESYIYAVAAVDQSGHESRLSEVAQVKIPSP